MSLVVTTCTVALCVLIPIHRLIFANHAADVYSPSAAWMRASIYFVYCILIAEWSGALEAAFASPIVTSDQLNNPVWWVSTIVVFAFILIAYWGYWARNTLQFGRKLNVFPQAIFGVLWGITSGLYFLALWHIAESIGLHFSGGNGWATWQVWLLAYLLISVWQMFWMDMFWDVYVSPEHDTPESIMAKVPRTHIPNMTLCLTYFAFYENYWLFVLLQTLALLAASFGMRMPAPWSKEPTPAARRVPGILGLSRAGGYIDKEA